MSLYVYFALLLVLLFGTTNYFVPPFCFPVLLDSKECPDTNWYNFRDRCYMLSVEREAWAEAEFVCRADGGHLAEIHDTETNTFIKNTVKSRNQATRGHHYFLGLADEAKLNVWEWNQSRQLVNFTDWGTKPHQQPDHYKTDEHCVILYQDDDYRWHDANCDDKNYFICEADAKDLGTEIIG